MRIAVVGVGAIGGLIGVRLARAGASVTLIDIGPTQEALSDKGLTLLTSEGSCLQATDAVVRDLETAGPQDLIVLAVKAYKLPEISPGLPQLYDRDTVVLPVQNGLPWWYFQRLVGPWSGRRIETLDPAGVLDHHIPAERILGCVVYPGAEVVEPGIVRHVEGNRVVIGELDNSRTRRVEAIIDVFRSGGLKSFFLDDLRGEVWLKLLGTAVFNPLSALTRATMVDMCRHQATRQLATNLMQEVEAVANAFGIRLRLPIERRLEGAEKLGHHKTSMLQDLEAGRRLEIDALVGAVVEIACWVDVKTPRLETIEAALRLLEKQTCNLGASNSASLATGS
jgi:2-dehydropantoate 2-reductase